MEWICKKAGEGGREGKEIWSQILTQSFFASSRDMLLGRLFDRGVTKAQLEACLREVPMVSDTPLQKKTCFQINEIGNEKKTGCPKSIKRTRSINRLMH